jgi:hypothetical protein
VEIQPKNGLDLEKRLVLGKTGNIRHKTTLGFQTECRNDNKITQKKIFNSGRVGVGRKKKTSVEI